jgi:4-amino-4-deoxy-L-arabinose transferase-like glycosyltransferase
VPVVLIAPLLLVARGKRIVMLTSAAIVAAPWFILCWLRNGNAFWDDFFWKQHVARFLTPSLEHVQPFWYYIPVLLAGLFPWTPLAALLAQRRLYSDRRVLLLAAWVLYGLIFFSVARNKLPGYLLPLFPALAIVLAAAFETAPAKTWWLAACALLLVGLPTVAGILPDALLAGVSRSHAAFAPGGLVFVGVAVVVWWLAWKQKTEAALLSVALAAGIGAVYVKYATFPALDRTVSVRSFWREHPIEVSAGCVDGVGRTWQYGLNYYAGHEVPECAAADSQRPHITTRDRQLAVDDTSVQKVVH